MENGEDDCLEVLGLLSEMGVCMQVLVKVELVGLILSCTILIVKICIKYFRYIHILVLGLYIV